LGLRVGRVRLRSGAWAHLRPSVEDITPDRYPTWLHVTGHAFRFEYYTRVACPAPLRHVG